MAIRVKNPIPKPKYKIGTQFKNIDTEEEFTLKRMEYDAYVLVDKKGKEKGESLVTLEYDYELIGENNG